MDTLQKSFNFPGLTSLNLKSRARLVDQYDKLKNHVEAISTVADTWQSNGKTQRKVTRERILEKLDFDASTGVFTWKTTHRAGLPAGFTGKERGKFYTRIRIDNELIMAHVLAWLVTHDEFPSFEIDHINGIGTDNRPSNLRKSNRLFNNSNTRKRADGKEHRNVSKSSAGYNVVVKYAKSTFTLNGIETLKEAVAARDFLETLIPRFESHDKVDETTTYKPVEGDADEKKPYLLVKLEMPN